MIIIKYCNDTFNIYIINKYLLMVCITKFNYCQIWFISFAKDKDVPFLEMASELKIKPIDNYPT